jgi:hypothetical protein
VSNVPSHTRTRKTHRQVVAQSRPTHDVALTGAEEVYEQINIDGVVQPGGIPPSMIQTHMIDPTAAIQNLINGPATVTVDSTGLTVANGALTIQDEFGKTVLVSNGFAGSWGSFVSLGLYNGNFAAGTPGAVPNGRTAALPYWTVSDFTGTTGTKTLVSSGGNRYMEFGFAALADIPKMVSDGIPVQPGMSYQPSYALSFVRSAGSLLVTVAVDVYDADLALLTTLTIDQVSVAVTTALNGYIASPVQMPAGAKYATLVMIFEESSHNSANKIRLWSAGLLQSDQSAVTVMPPFPATGVRVWRSDLSMEFFYDGTRWLSTTLYNMAVPNNDNGGPFPIAASAVIGRFVHPGLAPALDVYWVSQATSFFVSGGTALSGSHKWVVTLDKVDSASANTAIATLNIASGASSVWRTDVTALGVVNDEATYYTYRAAATKTGTPGPLYYESQLLYRLVAV